MTGLILIFILSALAWMNGDDSMRGFVIAGILFILIATIVGSCST